jgi:hypothetical protein
VRKVRIMGLCMGTVLALAIPASGAYAKSALHVTELGSEVANGAPARAVLTLDNCTSFTKAGKLTGNGTANVEVTTSENESVKCLVGTSESGVVTEEKWSSKGTVKLKAKIEVVEPGPCHYKFTKFAGSFELPGGLYFGGPTTGKLSKKGSSVSCTKEVTRTFVAAAAGEEELFEAEVF